MAEEIRVTVRADLDGSILVSETGVALIPPDYDQQDIDALAVRTIEDTAFDAVQERYGRQPTRRALLAAAARLRAIEDAIERMPRTGALIEHRDRIQAIFDLTNDQAIAQWGDDPEGG